MTGFSHPERRGLERMQIPKPESHPDADLLTAFAEHSLTPREQDQVLGHLAVCADCRDVIALAGSPLVEPVPEPARKRGLWEMPLFHWGAVAATTIIVVAAVSLGVRERHNSPTAAVLNETLPAPATTDRVAAEPRAMNKQELPAEAEIDAKLVTPATNSPQPAKRAPHLQEQVRYESPQNASDAKDLDASKDKEARRVSAGETVGGLVRPQVAGDNVSVTAASPEVTTTPAERDTARLSVGADKNLPLNGRNYAALTNLTPGSGAGADQSQKAEAKQAPAAAPPPKAQPSGGPQYAANVPSANETVTVTSQNVLVTENPPTVAQVAPAEQSQQSMLLKKAENARAKSMAPAPFHEVSPIKSVVTGTEWQITNDGTLQRSFNWGGRWENLLSGKSFRAVAVVRDHIWAGGDNGMLYFSSDNGRNWTPIVVHDAKGQVTGSIVRMRFSDAQNGSLDTSTGETWNTNDGGQSWHKQ